MGLKIFIYDKELQVEMGGVDLNADCRFRHVWEVPLVCLHIRENPTESIRYRINTPLKLPAFVTN